MTAFSLPLSGTPVVTHIPAHADRVGRRENPGGWACAGFLFATEQEAWDHAIAIARNMETILHDYADRGEEMDDTRHEAYTDFIEKVRLAVWGNHDHPLG